MFTVQFLNFVSISLSSSLVACSCRMNFESKTLFSAEKVSHFWLLFIQEGGIWTNVECLSAHCEQLLKFPSYNSFLIQQETASLYTKLLLRRHIFSYGVFIKKPASHLDDYYNEGHANG